MQQPCHQPGFKKKFVRLGNLLMNHTGFIQDFHSAYRDYRGTSFQDDDAYFFHTYKITGISLATDYTDKCNYLFYESICKVYMHHDL